MRTSDDPMNEVVSIRFVLIAQSICVFAVPNKVKPGRESAPDSSRKIPRAMRNEGAAERLRLGVYTIQADLSEDFEELETVEEICTHNAEACKSLGEHAKMETWKLVAFIVRDRIKKPGHGFDGWGGVRGGALGSLLVRNLLRFYESMGDVQMLSTLVCVLRGKRKQGKSGTERGWCLLPPDQNVKYDLFLRRYADLLYAWGLLTIRAEVNKHLRRTTSIEGGWSTDDCDDSPGIALVFSCPRCGGSSEFGYCRSCNDCAFRCAICDNAVRGLFTVCDR
jgi:hypothetical protein